MKDWTNTKIRHGTQSGWSLHQKLGENPCDACYRAKQQYDKRFRLAPAKTRQSRLNARAQAKAHSELSARHPDEYAELYLRYKQQISEEATADAE